MGAAALPAAAEDAPAEESWAIHGQLTYMEQRDDGFHSPYVGPYSLTPHGAAETVDATLYAGVRPWRGAEIWLNPELDQGFGLDNTQGLAGFPSGEAYKVGHNKPYFRLQRAFLRQTFNLSGESEAVEPAINQLAGTHEENRIVVTLGKFSVGDVFDANQYAHDPRMDFFNWTAIDTGSFDYAADAWGYTAGLAIEWYQGAWTTRFGLLDLSNIPNSPHLDPGFHEFQLIGELEHRHELFGRKGKVLLTAYDSRGRMGLLSDAIAQASPGTAPEVATVRAYRSRLGIGFSMEQSLTDDLGAFVRLGKAQGNVEAYEFTDIDRSAAVGLSLAGSAWTRKDDTLGLAAINNKASAERLRYLDAGGLGILVGDGRLPRPAPEQIMEAYYSLAVLQFLHLSLDYQFIEHPAYNTQRGPVSVYAVRAHAQF
jgi:high affinity Mn2+ porin